jgi:hypothetical protein
MKMEQKNISVWVIWLSSEEQSSILGAASTLDKAIEKVANFGDLSPKKRKTHYDGTIEIKFDDWNYLFFVPLVVDGDLCDFDASYYGLNIEDTQP